MRRLAVQAALLAAVAIEAELGGDDHCRRNGASASHAFPMNRAAAEVRRLKSFLIYDFQPEPHVGCCSPGVQVPNDLISDDFFREAGQPPGKTGKQILTNSPVKSKIQVLTWPCLGRKKLLQRIASVAGSVIQPAGRDMISNMPWPNRDAVVAPAAMQATLPLKKTCSASVMRPGNLRSNIIPL